MEPVDWQRRSKENSGCCRRPSDTHTRRLFKKPSLTFWLFSGRRPYHSVRNEADARPKRDRRQQENQNLWLWQDKNQFSGKDWPLEAFNRLSCRDAHHSQNRKSSIIVPSVTGCISSIKKPFQRFSLAGCQTFLQEMKQFLSIDFKTWKWWWKMWICAFSNFSQPTFLILDWAAVSSLVR